MHTHAKQLLTSSLSWLETSVFPLWTSKGIDSKNFGFVEALSVDGTPTASARRAMVQARQIFSYSEALKMGTLQKTEASAIIKNSTAFLLNYYSLPSGAFIHAVNADGSPESTQSELYTQAFVLFGLARSYEVLLDSRLKDRALKLVEYLQNERRAPHGGYVEIKNDQPMYQSNPHMHLFEAVLEWAHIDDTPLWKDLCLEVFELCKGKFIDRETGTLCENFDEHWEPLRANGRFVFEPGHHYEWAWLLLRFQALSKVNVGDLPLRLFELAEKYGFGKARGFAVDEVWSDFSIKKDSSRFWPQTERVKAAVLLGTLAAPVDQPRFAAAADEAMKSLWAYLDSPAPGHWQDTRMADGEFIPLAAKSSSLYHIINAISEYAAKRPLLQDGGSV